MSFKIPEDLPDQNKGIKGEKFAASAKLRSELHAAVTKAGRLAEKQFISSNPDAAKLAYVHQGHAYEKKPGFGSVVPKIVDYMVLAGRAKLTQKAILEEVRKNLPNQVIQDNIWSKPLRRGVLSKLQTRITGNMARPISIDGCKTLSDIKKKLKASLTVKDAVFTAKQFVPSIVNNALTVTISNQQTNTESDIVVYRLPAGKADTATSIAAINDIVTDNLLHTDIAIVQCKTNWNDNAQVPMLWDLIYNSKEFRIPNVSVGIKGVNPASFRRFAYAFMTVPTSKGPFNPTSLAVLRVKNMTGGNYWGRKSTAGVSSCINEFFRNFPDVFTGGVMQHLKKQLEDPAVLEAFLSLKFDVLKQQSVAE